MDAAQELLIEVASKHRLATAGREDKSLVRKAYEGRTIFITGGSGFLGKHLLEKLFRSCNIKKAYLLLRPKKGKSIQERLKQLSDDVVYDGLRETHPDFVNKLVPIEGDVKEIRLGISDGDWKTIIEEAEIIFHAAATINFEEPIQMATLTNVRGTREMTRLARECRKLRAFVHISTAYCQATRDRVGKQVQDRFYASPVAPELLIDMAEKLDQDLLNSITPQLIHRWPNTYTFTKAVAEDVIRAAHDLPIAVVRPAIVVCAYREPSPGWLDPTGVYGPSGLVFGGGLGILHVLKSSRSAVIDLVPVDYVNNAVIAAGWAVIEEAKKIDNGVENIVHEVENTDNTVEKEAKVYTIATTRHNMCWGDKHNVLYEEVSPKYMTPKAVWYAFMLDVENQYLYQIMFWLMHYMPAYVLDGLRLCLFKPPFFVKLYTRAAKLQRVLSYFTTNEWHFEDQNTLQLYKKLNNDDQILFNFDIATIDWKEQIVLWAIGVRKYLVKDGLVDSELGRRRQFWFKILHYILTAVFFYVLWKIVSVLFSFIFSVL